jgi:chaperonin GroES
MIKPIKDQILVKPEESEKKTSSGLYIPDSAQEGPVKGIIVAVGSSEDITVAEGETVLYVQGSGINTKHNEEEFVFLKEEQILATIAE